MPQMSKNWPRSEGLPLRCLHVDDPVECVRVEPHDAAPRDDERPGARLLALERRADADAVGHLVRLALHEDRQVGVDVVVELLAGLARDPVDLLAELDRLHAGEDRALGHGDVLGAERPG